MNNYETFSLYAEPEHPGSDRVRVRFFAGGQLAGTLILTRREWKVFGATFLIGVDFVPRAGEGTPIIIVHIDESKLLEADKERARG